MGFVKCEASHICSEADHEPCLPSELLSPLLRVPALVRIRPDGCATEARTGWGELQPSGVDVALISHINKQIKKNR